MQRKVTKLQYINFKKISKQQLLTSYPIPSKFYVNCKRLLKQQPTRTTSSKACNVLAKSQQIAWNPRAAKPQKVLKQEYQDLRLLFLILWAVLVYQPPTGILKFNSGTNYLELAPTQQVKGSVLYKRTVTLRSARYQGSPGHLHLRLAGYKFRIPYKLPIFQIDSRKHDIYDQSSYKGYKSGIVK